MNFTKRNEHPELPSQALVLYTDGRRSDSGRTGSGVFMKTNTEEFLYRFRNPYNSSVFRSELVVIREALNLALDNRASDTWILTDSKSSIQFLKDWSNVLDMLGQDILLKLAALTQTSVKNIYVENVND
ncbi:RNase H domain-containing protein [Trichonephila clavata]|uniref:RNase H domain-containing protein n=1 Tax=Trichonephila clavata TaxID=2740835 RepID=A0A8X6LBN9_TRICU|nr:RNase H domain-containing protein [Trichonephila clavata]